MAKPQIRFKGFGEEWEVFIMENFLEKCGEKNINNLPYESYTVSNSMGFINQKEQFKNGGLAISADKSKSIIIPPNSFAYNPARIDVGSIGYLKSNTNVLISPMYEVFRTNGDGINDDFLFIWFKSKHFNKIVLSSQEGGVRTCFSFDKLKKVQTKYPSNFSEQTRIANLFTALDKQISCSEAKLEKLRTVKNTLLKKMFVSTGEKIPEIRFKGFDGEWEEKTLGEISKKVITKNTDGLVDITLTNSAEFGIINQTDFFDKEISNKKNISGYYVVSNNDFVYNPRISTLAPVGPINRNKLTYVGVMSPLYYVFRPHSIDFNYLEYFFKTKVWHPFMFLNGNSGARSDRFSISETIFNQMPINIPKDSAEQSKIATVFIKLDNQINTQEQKVEKLRAIKKTLLKKMFV